MKKSNEKSQEKRIIGIDVSKQTLDMPDLIRYPGFFTLTLTLTLTLNMDVDMIE